MLYRLVAIQGGKSLPNVSPYVFKAVRPESYQASSVRHKLSGLINKRGGGDQSPWPYFWPVAKIQ